MRASVGDRGIFGAEVYVDGVQAHRCIMADEDRGIAVVYATGPDGGLILNEARDGAVVETLRGAVRIDLPAAYWRSRR